MAKNNSYDETIENVSLIPMAAIETIATSGNVFFYCASAAVRIDKIAPGKLKEILLF